MPTEARVPQSKKFRLNFPRKFEFLVQLISHLQNFYDQVFHEKLHYRGHSLDFFVNLHFVNKGYFRS